LLVGLCVPLYIYSIYFINNTTFANKFLLLSKYNYKLIREDIIVLQAMNTDI